MNDRSFLTPILLLVAIGAPIVYHQMEDRKSAEPGQPNSPDPFYHAFYHDGIETAAAGDVSRGNWNPPISEPKEKNELFDSVHFRRSPRNLSSQTHSVPTENSFQTAGFSRPAQPSPTIINPSTFDPQTQTDPGREPREPVRQNQNSGPGIASLIDLPDEQPLSNPTNPFADLPERTMDQNRQPNFSNAPTDKLFPMHHPLQPPTQNQPAVNGGSVPIPMVAYHSNGQLPIHGTVVENGLPMANMVPDYGAAETLVFPGNAFGPDLTAQPMETIPVSDFNEIFRFDISREWVKQRWKRVSTNPTADGLSGLRVALVTGTNSWDLNGALTYYFDKNQKLQRISYRGWAGDPQKLLQLLTTKFKFESQPTNIAGYYLARNWRKTKSGLLMKEPPVIDTRNVLQQLGIVMEINNPDSSIELSDEFHALIAGSIQE